MRGGTGGKRVKKVLVTGVGAIIGYGVLRSLRNSAKSLYLIGADIHEDAAGRNWCDEFLRAPLTADPGYRDWLADALRSRGVDLLIPGIEQDVLFLSGDRNFCSALPAKVVLNRKSLVDICLDKWKTFEELKRLGSELTIPSFVDGDFDRLSSVLGLPFLMKPRRGHASKGIRQVRNAADFSAVQDRFGAELMAQAIVGTSETEYTVAAFGDGHGKSLGGITLLRKLSPDGSTSKAWVRHVPELDGHVAALCEHFEPIGPTNFQFRRDVTGWKLLEINPRISSSTSIRTAFGYNEAAMCVDFFLESRAFEAPRIRSGFAIRYIEDLVFHDRDHF